MGIRRYAILAASLAALAGAAAGQGPGAPYGGDLIQQAGEQADRPPPRVASRSRPTAVSPRPVVSVKRISRGRNAESPDPTSRSRAWERAWFLTIDREANA